MLKKISYIMIVLLYSIIIYRIIDIKYINNEKYITTYLEKTNNIISGESAKRGRILDTNLNVIVDNVSTYNINYRIINNKSNDNIYNDAKIVSNILNLDGEANTKKLKDFYILFNDTTYLLTDNEINDYIYRKLDDNQIYDIKYNRIEDELNIYTHDDKVFINTFYLMTNGYINQTKKIKEDVSYEECLKITEQNIDGLSCDISWKRVNNYPIINSIVGSVGSILSENKDEYLNMGYKIDDKVGISGLEKYYDKELRGIDSKYEIQADNSLKLVNDEVIGKDLVLALDINLINKSYEILTENFKLAQTMRNTNYFNQAYIIISKPNTGEIISLLGLQKNKINKDISYTDISSNALISSYTLGSIVKGASHTVGYLNNLIDVGKKINDSCVKLYNVPAKCSFKRLGYIDDISALKMSSNYYQFITAIKSTGNNYYNNIKIDVNEDNFNLYRDVFKKYGLGTSTYIDFPKESYGLKGDKISADLLLNLAIGQYDTYTPIGVSAYINTIAMKGKRYALSFKKQENKIVDEVNLDEEYMNRIHKGFYDVLNNGTGMGYTDNKYKPAGKTGTSQNYYNKDIMTINSSYIMFAPVDNPKYSVVVITPNVSYYDGNNDYIAPINRLISKSITNYLFENY